MPKLNFWKRYPMPPDWEEKYDPSTKLSYFVDHANKRSSWTDPRSRYYGNDKTTTDGEVSLQGNGNETLSEPPLISLSSADILERNAYVKLSCASKTNSIVKKFLTDEHKLKHHQLQRRNKSSSTSRRSIARKARGRSLDPKSCSPPPTIPAPAHTSCQPLHYISRRGASANSESIKDGTALGEVVVGQRVPKHEVMDQPVSVPETGELCLTLLHTESASTQDSVKRTRSPRSSCSESGGNSEPICDALEHRQLGRPKKSVILSGLLIQAKGPDQSLLCRRILANGPDPTLYRGPNPSLVHGPNPTLLRRNRPWSLSFTP